MLITLLFPFFGLLAVATVAAFRMSVWLMRDSWQATVALCIWTGRATVATARYAQTELWPVARDGSIAFHRRFGLRGWAIAGGGIAAVALVVLLVGLLRQ